MKAECQGTRDTQVADYDYFSLTHWKKKKGLLFNWENTTDKSYSKAIFKHLV